MLTACIHKQYITVNISVKIFVNSCRLGTQVTFENLMNFPNKALERCPTNYHFMRFLIFAYLAKCNSSRAEPARFTIFIRQTTWDEFVARHYFLA